MKQLSIFILLFLALHSNAYSDVFHLKHNDGRVTRTISYSPVVVKNNDGVIIFSGKTDKYGRVKVINTEGNTIEVTYNGRTHIKKPIAIKNNTEETTVVFRD